MKNKEEKKNRVWVPIVIGAVACSVAVGTGVALVHNQQRPKASAVATVSDAMENAKGTTEVAEVTTEETTTEAVVEVVSNEGSKPEAVPATTEIGGGKKKAEETTEEKKPSTSSDNGSGYSSTSGNGGSANSGQSTTPKPSNSGSSSGNSGSSSSGNSGSSNSDNSGNSGSNNGGSSNSGNGNATNNTPQHQHNYNVWVKTKDAWDETVVDTPEQTIYHPEEGYYVPAKQCNTCGQVFTSSDDFKAHQIDYGGWCDCSGSGTTHVYVKTKDEYTEVIPAKTHTVHHDEEGYWACSCGARK